MHYPSALLQMKKYFSFHFEVLSEVLSRVDLMHKLVVAVGLELSIYFFFLHVKLINAFFFLFGI